jgi:hypothetical protein
VLRPRERALATAMAKPRMKRGAAWAHAQVLGVDVRYFFEGIGGDDPFRPTQQQRLLLELARNFMAIPHRRHQEEIVSLVRALAEPAQPWLPVI